MARKHPVSPNQTVLWTWHSLSPAWGSRALHEPQEKTRKSASRPRRKDRSASAVSALTATEGVCTQVKQSPRRVRATGGRGPVRRRTVIDDLV